MYNSFNISMEFELHGVKFKYEDGVMYRWWDKGKKNYWRCKKLETDKDGYLKLSIYNKTANKYLLHRIVYWVHNPNWDIYDKVNVIDHIDRVKKNNDISNLRLVTRQENNFNTEFKGYSYDRYRDAYNARIIVDRKSIYLGYFKNKEDAHQAYLDAKEKYHII
jgi:hypothetical protein